jgi:hypothetical protein
LPEQRKRKRRHAWSHHFPPADARLTQLTELERRLLRPRVPVTTLLTCRNGQCACRPEHHVFNDAAAVCRKLPRLPSVADYIVVRNGNADGTSVTWKEKIRPELLRCVLHDLLDADHPAYRGVEMDEDALAALHADSGASCVIDDHGAPPVTADESDHVFVFEDATPTVAD